MDLEQLKIFMDAVGKMSDGAFWAFVIYICQGYLAIIAWFAGFMVLFRMLFKVVKGVIVGENIRNLFNREYHLSDKELFQFCQYLATKYKYNRYGNPEPIKE